MNLGKCFITLFRSEIFQIRAKAMRLDEGVYVNIRQGEANRLQPNLENCSRIGVIKHFLTYRLPYKDDNDDNVYKVNPEEEKDLEDGDDESESQTENDFES